MAERRPASFGILTSWASRPSRSRSTASGCWTSSPPPSSSDPASWPDPSAVWWTSPVGAELKRIKAMVEEKAKASNIPPELVASKEDHPPVLHLELAHECRGRPGRTSPCCCKGGVMAGRPPAGPVTRVHSTRRGVHDSPFHPVQLPSGVAGIVAPGVGHDGKRGGEEGKWRAQRVPHQSS